MRSASTDHKLTPEPGSRLATALAPLRLLAAALACCAAGLAPAAQSAADAAAALRANYEALQTRPGSNPFQRPLYLESSETPGGVAGDIHALVNHPFASAGSALSGPANWCDILLLHLNTKYCRASSDGHGSNLRVYIGKKHPQALADAYPVDFTWRVAAASPNYLKVMLNADEGPLSTRNYRIVLEAVPLDGDRTLLHLAYSYGYGFAGRVAMQAYLGTIGSDKLGFSIEGQQSDGRPIYIGGMRGLVERNTMRYYLAIESYLGAMSTPPPARLEKSLHDWFAAIERHPRQLHELEQGEYLAMKRKEYLRARVDLRAP